MLNRIDAIRGKDDVTGHIAKCWFHLVNAARPWTLAQPKGDYKRLVSVKTLAKLGLPLRVKLFKGNREYNSELATAKSQAGPSIAQVAAVVLIARFSRATAAAILAERHPIRARGIFLFKSP